MFIKLTSLILNTRLINSIFIKPDKYYIRLSNTIINGTFISSNEKEFVVCKNKNPIDYKIISEWIYKI